jgi:hypothetical protein
VRYYPPVADRLWAKVDRSDAGGCWQWTGGLTANGYGIPLGDGERQIFPHRLAWELANGPIPAGLVMDHLCRNQICCNPAHLEPVTIAENVLRGEGIAAQCARKTHCLHGHPLSGENLRFSTKGARVCITCARRRCNEGQRRKRQLEREARQANGPAA